MSESAGAPPSNAELLWQFDRDLAAGCEPAWDAILQQAADQDRRRELCADMVRCEASLREFDLELVQTRLRLYAQFDDSDTGAASIIRGIYTDRLAAGEHPTRSEFEVFGYEFARMKLRSDDEPAYLGQIVAGRFQVEQRLGSGTFGVVYRGLELATRRTVALKMIRVTGADQDSVARTLLRQEADVLAKLRTTGIPQLLDYLEDSECGPVLVLEHVEGEPLCRVIQQGPVVPERAARIVARLADSLQYAHRRGYLHRDLSASNVLLDQSDVPYLLDFGLGVGQAELFDHDRHTAGTQRYMSVESRLGATREIDHRDDIYSLGVILYELLTGPCAANTVRDRPERTRNSNFVTKLVDPELDVPPALRLICLRCVDDNADYRYDTAALLARELREFLGENNTQSIEVLAEQARRRLLAWRAGFRYGCAYRRHTYVRLRLERLHAAGQPAIEQCDVALNLMFHSEIELQLQFSGCTEFARRLGLTLAEIPGRAEFQTVGRNRRAQTASDTVAWLMRFVEGVDRTLVKVLAQLESHLSPDGQETMPLLQLGMLCGSLAIAPDSRDTLLRLTAAARLPSPCTLSFIDATTARYSDKVIAVGHVPDAIDRERDRTNKSVERELSHQLADELDGHYPVATDLFGKSSGWAVGSIAATLRDFSPKRDLFG